MAEQLYFTNKGLKNLKLEIDELTKKLEEIQAQSAYVAEVGGNQYHDNSSYEMLVIDLRGIDWLLTKAHNRLNRAVLVYPVNTTEKVSIGTSVKIMRNLKEERWVIAGYGESDPKKNILAYNTPIASSIMGRQEGETVSVNIAGVTTEIEIVEITKEVANECLG